jgi:hypothetical protein
VNTKTAILRHWKAVRPALRIDLGTYSAWPRVWPHSTILFHSLFYPLIQRLHDAGVDSGNDVHGRVKVLFAYVRFPCVRKATLYSGLAVASHGHGQSQENLLSLTETRDAVCLTIKSAKIGPLQDSTLLSPFINSPRKSRRS